MHTEKVNIIDMSLNSYNDNDNDNNIVINGNETAVSLPNIESVLNMESAKYKKEPWCRLDKTTKINKINIYVNTILKKKHSLTDNEVKNVVSYLTNCLDKVKLQKVREVDYKKDQGLITNIPALFFEKTTRKFTLKRCEKRVNTVRSLSKPRSRTMEKQKTKRRTDNNIDK